VSGFGVEAYRFRRNSNVVVDFVFIPAKHRDHRNRIASAHCLACHRYPVSSWRIRMSRGKLAQERSVASAGRSSRFGQRQTLPGNL
jgi:hypothetical protein